MLLCPLLDYTRSSNRLQLGGRNIRATEWRISQRGHWRTVCISVTSSLPISMCCVPQHFHLHCYMHQGKVWMRMFLCPFAPYSSPPTFLVFNQLSKRFSTHMSGCCSLIFCCNSAKTYPQPTTLIIKLHPIFPTAFTIPVQGLSDSRAKVAMLCQTWQEGLHFPQHRTASLTRPDRTEPSRDNRGLLWTHSNSPNRKKSASGSCRNKRG